jgi:hypothetical protein
MKLYCQESGCSKEPKRSWICDPKTMICSDYFIDVHQSLPGNHKSIEISDKIKHFYSNIKEVYQKLK